MSNVRKKKTGGVGCCSGALTEHYISSPLGTITITVCPAGLHNVSQPPNLNDENFSPNKRCEVELENEDKMSSTKVVRDCVDWLEVYFRDPSHLTTVTRPNICHIQGDKLGFRARVWQVLADTVGPGEVITYGALADRLNNPGAVRAVGSAMSNNPVGLIVPCHRVIRSNGLGLYHGGQRQAVKLWLLRHEGINKF